MAMDAAPAPDAARGTDDTAATRTALAAALRARPDDQQARMHLFQLLCVERDWDRARAQLRILAAQSAEAGMLAAAYGQAMDAMPIRAAALAGRGAAPLLGGELPWAAAFVAASVDGDRDRRDEALAQAPDTPGDVDGRPFGLIFDGDTRFGPTIEAIVGGRWGLIPFASIESIETEGPVDLRDLVWLPAEIRLRDGAGLAALLPVTYPGTAAAGDPALRLARRTEWIERDGAVHGLGQRIWTTDAGDDVPILGFRRIRFDRAA